MKILDCLPDNIAVVVDKYHSSVRQLHLREGKPPYINIGGMWYYIYGEYITNTSIGCDVLLHEDIDGVLNSACGNSIFAYEQQLANGFMTIEDGVRLGVSGKIVDDDKGIKCFSRYNSICVRFAHCIVGCSSVVDATPTNTVIIGAPGTGKTTLVRDLACRISQSYNCVVIDDRGEIAGCKGFDANSLNVDIMSNGDKSNSIISAIRSLCPSCILTDEITTSHIPAIKQALSSGVSVYATLHGISVDSAKVFENHGIFFDRYIILDNMIGNAPKVVANTHKSR